MPAHKIYFDISKIIFQYKFYIFIMKKFILILSAWLLLSINSAYAYIDPGTGSIIIQGIIGFVAAALATIKIYWQKIKLFLKKISKTKKK